MPKYYQYFVEGQCEKKLIDELKLPKHNVFTPGKVEVFNFINNKITLARLRTLKPKTIIFLVYDIDVENDSILKENLSMLKYAGFHEIYHIQSIRNFEDELVYSSNMKNIHSMFDTNSIEEFKAKFISQNNLPNKLTKINFKKEMIWTRPNNKEPFNTYFSKAAQSLIKKK